VASEDLYAVLYPVSIRWRNDHFTCGYHHKSTFWRYKAQRHILVISFFVKLMHSHFELFCLGIGQRKLVEDKYLHPLLRKKAQPKGGDINYNSESRVDRIASHPSSTICYYDPLSTSVDVPEVESNTPLTHSKVN